MRCVEIEINGVSYPCVQTMGAMLRFKELTGREATEIDPRSLSDLCRFLWCCIVSACRRQGREFPMSLMDFADAVGSEELARWQESFESVEREESAADEKKNPPG